MSTASGLPPVHRRAFEFRQLVGLFLESKGIPNRIRPGHKIKRQTLAETFAGPEQPKGDVWNVPNWLISTRTDVARDLSGALDQAAHDAEVAGVPHSAVIWRRHGREVQESYVVLPLATFGDVLKEARDDG
ncbi:hypothetical protein [Agromyces aerolatus]|uniref:hypothetical protein n=1 Tax=Agromyces sp. LY-1074 TaxID=3074080 RepID=UPI0028666C2E|nr:MULTISPECIES: hypothetical protein [unclassified Agromyces]MDR5699957.1 hypothetical protein [Agromyces sp. LY-1074]MDR5706231.1 hypothetical protein [Agromyces sp. LY-1358]